MSKYILKQHYPSLPESFTPGTIVFLYAPIVGFAYYSDMYDKHHLRKEEVENHPNYFEKIKSEAL